MIKERKDWLNFADHDEIRKEYLAGPQDLTELAPGVWGIKGLCVITLGDKEHMRKIQANLFQNKFHRKPCSKDVYPEGSALPLPTVYERLFP